MIGAMAEMMGKQRITYLEVACSVQLSMKLL